MLGDRIDAECALAWGLVQSVQPREMLRERAIAVAAKIASRDRVAVRRIRDLARAAATRPPRDGLALELATAIDHLSGSEPPDALRRFADKAADRDARSGHDGARGEV
jgi:enoyl-CoA hydratase/carnithine racemase